MSARAVILVGHGGVPSDFPRQDLTKLKALEGRRRAQGGPMTEEERALDAAIRRWPRTAESDPYQAGFERLGAALRSELAGDTLYLAYNEFCAPTIEEAAALAVAAGASSITIVPSMLTPGGVHAEVEIPEVVEALQRAYPGARIVYAWPFDLAGVAAFFATHVRAAQREP
jgi:sirohydrochlorin cobaltochelatase